MTAEPLPDPPQRPGVRRSDPRKRRTLNRDAIVDIALAIVDEEGLEGLSMRRVADRLETGPASLYAHVANKDELMELVYDQVLAEVQVQEPDKRRWEEQLKDALRQLYDVLVAHRDIAFVSMARIPIGPNTAARPMTGPQMPNALGSSSVEKTSLITPRPWGIISAPKAPCTRRNAISIPGELASPHAIEAAVKPAAPIRKRRRRPKMSPSRPPVTRPTLNASA